MSRIIFLSLALYVSVLFLTRYTVSSGVHLCGVPEVIGSLKSVDCSGLYTLLIVGANEEKKVKSLMHLSRKSNCVKVFKSRNQEIVP